MKYYFIGPEFGALCYVVFIALDPRWGSLPEALTVSKWDLEMLVLEEREKLECMERNVSEQRKEPTTNQPTYGIETGIWTPAILVGG